MPTIEFEGKNTEEAIEKACSQLHIPSNELKFEILTTGSSGIFGIGGKKARIRVEVEERIGRKTVEVSETKPEEAQEKAEIVETGEPEPRREFHRKGEKRHSPRRSDRKSSRVGREEKRTDSSKGEKKERERRRPRTEEREENLDLPMPENMPIAATLAGPGEEVYDGPEDALMTVSREALEGILGHMSIVAKVGVQKIQDRIILKLEGENCGLLIGKKGATLDALQYLINKIVNKSEDEKIRIVVDAEDYRVRRHQALIDLARRMAEKAKRNKRPVTISQLTAHDRRVVHLALQDVPGLKTRSRGEGPLKNVIVIPEGRRDSEKKKDVDEPTTELGQEIQPDAVVNDENGDEY